MGNAGSGVQDGDSDATWVFSSIEKGYSQFLTVIVDAWRSGTTEPQVFPMDTLNTLLLGWLIFGVLIVLLAKFLYDKFISGDNDCLEDLSPGSSDPNGPKLPDGGCFRPLPNQASVKAKIVPDGPPARIPAPTATGGDPDAVRWINNLLVWLYEGHEGGSLIKNAWNDRLNEFTVGSALETGVLVEVLEFLPQTPAPTLSNIIVDCSPVDNMTVTCDIQQTLYLRIQTTRTQRDVTTESEYACAVSPLRGRLSVAIKTAGCLAQVKFDGWPEVCLKLEGIRNNADGLNEEQLQEVVKEMLVSAFRKVVLDLDFHDRRTFPRFSRSKNEPGTIFPVGYDALVRENQTHPPSYIPVSIGSAPLPVSLVSSALDSGSSKERAYEYDLNGTDSDVVFIQPSFQFSSYIDIDDEKYLEGSSYRDVDSCHGNEIAPLANGNSLTKSEESLIARTLENSGSNQSPPDSEMSAFVAELPVDEGSFSTREDVSKWNGESYSGIQPKRSSVVFSSRQKPIDECRVKAEDGAVGRLADESGTSEQKENDEEAFEELKRYAEELPSSKGLRQRGRNCNKESPPKSHGDSFRREMERMKDCIRNNSLRNHLSSFGPFKQSLSASSTPAGITGLNGKRLLVKVVKATGIGGDSGVKLSYAVVEMDDPPQKFTTSTVNDSVNPFWDEQFLFDLSDNTLELLFEIYDKSDSRFLGLGIVGIEELVATPSQRQIIPLQSRPYENDGVSGSLTCEFLFLDRADLPDLTLRGGSGGVTLGSRVKSLSRSARVHSDEDDADCTQDGSAFVPSIFSNSARRSKNLQNHRDEERPSSKGSPTQIGNSKELTNGLKQRSTEVDRNHGNQIEQLGTTKPKRSGLQPSPANQTDSAEDRNESPSLEYEEPEAPVLRNNSFFSRTRKLLSVPSLRGRSHLILGRKFGSTRSSLSGTSEFSSVSTKTYVNEASLLVLEVFENGLIKHYLVPLSLQNNSKWKKKGTKLHVYNEHTFIAKHMSSSTSCQVCKKSFPRRLGKQCYECRDCSFLCHKPCHVKVETVCPNSTANTLDLVFIKEENDRKDKAPRSS